MGQLTDARMKAWQQHAGLHPPVAARRELLDRMSECAFKLIRIIECELSGIRDGDGQWHGGDPVGGTC